MPEFLELLPPLDALAIFLPQVRYRVGVETLPTRHALGRVLAQDVLSDEALPAFPRSTVDGFAVRAADTYGASESLPAYLRLAGEIPMGKAAQLQLAAGECATIHTGGMLPEGADSVIMIEYTQLARPQEIELLRAVAVGENVLKVGEEIQPDQVVINAGSILRPAEIGGLMALGRLEIQVRQKPRVGIISSGDEVIPPAERPAPGQVRDVNAYSLAALVEQAGGEPVLFGISNDTLAALRAKAQQALETCALVVITAGSSASTRDLTAEVINSLGEPGVLVHGVNVRPGKPTILGVCQGKAVIGLPGNPVSALVIAGLFLKPVIRSSMLQESQPATPHLLARLALNLGSQAGREDWVPVSLEAAPAAAAPAPAAGQPALIAHPVFGKSNFIFNLVHADGLVRIPAAANGLPAGSTVEVYLI